VNNYLSNLIVCRLVYLDSRIFRKIPLMNKWSQLRVKIKKNKNKQPEKVQKQKLGVNNWPVLYWNFLVIMLIKNTKKVILMNSKLLDLAKTPHQVLVPSKLVRFQKSVLLCKINQLSERKKIFKGVNKTDFVNLKKRILWKGISY